MAEDLTSSTAAAWTRFQARLADHLLEMEEDDLLLLEAESVIGAEDGAAPYIQFCAWGEGRLRCEAVSNHYLASVYQLDAVEEDGLVELGFEPPTWESEDDADAGSANYWVDAELRDADRLAVMAVRALRDVYGVQHPAFLEGRPFSGDPVPDGSGGSPTVELEEEPAVYPDGGRAQLQSLVDETLTPSIGHPPVHDEDGDIPIDCGDVVVFVRVLPDKPVIRLFACVAHEVADRRRAEFEVAVLNRDRLFFKFLLAGDAILMQTDVVAWPFAPAHLRDLVDHMCRSVGQIHDDLAARLGGIDEVDTVDQPGDGGGGVHPAMRTLLELDADEPGSVDARLAAAICGHDRELILELLQGIETQGRGLGRRMTKLLRGALRVTVERQARSAEATRSPHRRVHRGGSSRRRAPDPTLEEVDPEMWS